MTDVIPFLEAYKHCPRCAGSLKRVDTYLMCDRCGFHVYNNPLACNAAIIENEKGEILLVKRKYDPLKGYWDLPGGFIEPGEDLKMSVEREVKEELGVDVRVGELVGHYADTYDYQGVRRPSYCAVVVATIQSGEPQPLDDAELITYFSKKDVLKQRFAFPMLKIAVTEYLQRT